MAQASGNSVLKSVILAALTAGLVGLSVSGAVQASPENYPFLSLTRAMQESAQKNRPMFLYFGRHGCSTCLKMHAEVFTDPGLRKTLSENFVLAYVDTESAKRIRLPSGERTTEMQFAARSRILGTPTFVYFSAGQQPLFTRVGFQTIGQMQAYSDFVLGGHYRDTTLQQFLGAR